MSITSESSPGRCAATRRPGRTDAGFTFVEIVVSIVLIGTVVVGLLASTRAAISASARSREAAQVETALLNAADRVSRAGIKCNVGEYEQFVDSAITSWNGRGSATVVSVQHYVYNAATGAFAAGTWSGATPCPAQSTQKKVQRVVVGPTGLVSRDTEVVKGDV